MGLLDIGKMEGNVLSIFFKGITFFEECLVKEMLKMIFEIPLRNHQQIMIFYLDFVITKDGKIVVIRNGITVFGVWTVDTIRAGVGVNW